MTISRRHLQSLSAAVLAALAVALVAVGTVDAAPAAHAAARAKACDISAVADRLGPTSVTSLKVLHVRCDRGIAVVRAFHACRLAHGVSGRCVRLVKGYACNEQRTSGPTQFSASVTCAKGRARVVHRYTQATA